MSDGENGFLTDRDKAFLQADGDYYRGANAKNQRYETREAIAERARQAFHDFAFLFNALDERERNRIFDPPGNETVELKGALQDTISFLYHSLEGDVDQPAPFDRSLGVNFNQIFEPGIKQGEIARLPSGERAMDQLFSGYGYVKYDPYRVEFVQNPAVPDPDEIVEKLVESGVRDVSDEELRALIQRSTRETCMPEPASESPHAERFDLHKLADRVAERADARGTDATDVEE